MFVTRVVFLDGDGRQSRAQFAGQRPPEAHGSGCEKERTGRAGGESNRGSCWVVYAAFRIVRHASHRDRQLGWTSLLGRTLSAHTARLPEVSKRAGAQGVSWPPRHARSVPGQQCTQVRVATNLPLAGMRDGCWFLLASCAHGTLFAVPCDGLGGADKGGNKDLC